LPRRSRVHLENVLDKKDLNFLLCPECGSKLEIRSFGPEVEDKVLSCTKCKNAWKLKEYQCLYKAISLGVKGSKCFF